MTEEKLKEAERNTKLFATGKYDFPKTPEEFLDNRQVGNFIICQFCKNADQREQKYHFINRKPTCKNCRLARNYWGDIKTKNSASMQ